MTKRDRKNICVLIAKRLINKSKIKVDFKVIFSSNVAGWGFLSGTEYSGSSKPDVDRALCMYYVDCERVWENQRCDKIYYWYLHKIDPFVICCEHVLREA